jgi:hypothetical protein
MGYNRCDDAAFYQDLVSRTLRTAVNICVVSLMISWDQAALM